MRVWTLPRYVHRLYGDRRALTFHWQATELDPSYAKAWGRLAAAEMVSGTNVRQIQHT